MGQYQVSLKITEWSSIQRTFCLVLGCSLGLRVLDSQLHIVYHIIYTYHIHTENSACFIHHPILTPNACGGYSHGTDLQTHAQGGTVLCARRKHISCWTPCFNTVQPASQLSSPLPPEIRNKGHHILSESNVEASSCDTLKVCLTRPIPCEIVLQCHTPPQPGSPITPVARSLSWGLSWKSSAEAEPAVRGARLWWIFRFVWTWRE